MTPFFRQRFPQTLLASAVLSASAGIAAEPGPVDFNIQPQALDSALTRFSAATGLQVLYDSQVADSIHSAELRGHYSAEQGLQKLLNGSGLRYRFSNSKTVTLEKVADNSPLRQPAPSTTLPTINVVDKNLDDSTDPYNEDYRVIKNATATKTDTPLIETPVSVQVISQQVLKDQQAFRLEDALKNVSGVQREHGGGSFLDSFVIRGFENRFVRFRNGKRLGATSSFGFTQELANVQQIEVLKGPASVLYGRIEPGGLINVTTKKPLDEPYYAVEQQFGSYDLYRTSVDATGPLSDNNELLYRLNFSYLNRGSFRDFLDNERFFVAPTITWRPSDDTEVNLTFEYRKETDQFDSGIPAVGNRPAAVPISRRFDLQPGLNSGNEVRLLDFDVTHKIDQAWTVHGGFLGSFADFDQALVIPVNILPDNRTIERAIFSDSLNGSSISQEDISAVLDLTGKFNYLGSEHTVLVGADYYKGSGDAAELTLGFAPIDTIDLLNPVQGTTNHEQLLRNNPLDGFFATRQSWYGVYLQDQVTLWDKLHVLGGGRYDWVENENGSSFTTASDLVLTKTTAQRFSPRFGLTYNPVPWLAFYGNYVESLGASNGRSTTGQGLQPETAQQFEAGVKLDLLDGKLTSTLAVFEITKLNVLTPDLSTADPSDSTALGQARSRGVELDVSGQITDRTKLIATYALTDAVITRDNSGNQGNRIPNVPTHAGSLWVRFDAIPAKFETGAGVYLAGQRQGDIANSFQLPGYVRVDAFLAYHWKLNDSRLTAQLNVNNIFDKTYYYGGEPSFSFPRVNIIPADPATVLGSLRLEF